MVKAQFMPVLMKGKFILQGAKLHLMSFFENFIGDLTKGVYYTAIIGFGALLLLLLYTLKPTRKSNFALREADRVKSQSKSKISTSHFTAKSDSGVYLTGIRLDLPPHDLLGINKDATPKEIQKAYRTLMKLYHPDKVARPGTQSWLDAQAIAEAINNAKDMMLKSRRF